MRLTNLLCVFSGVQRHHELQEGGDRPAAGEAEDCSEGRRQGEGRQEPPEGGYEDVAASRRGPASDDSHPPAVPRHGTEVQDGAALRRTP